MFDYYLGWFINGGLLVDYYWFVDMSIFGFVCEWGMKIVFDDVCEVVCAVGYGG